MAFGEIFLAGRRTQRVVPIAQESAILPARVANHNVGLGSSCPLTELAM